MTWWEAYLRQARSDWATLARLRSAIDPAPLHDQLHYVQMACERLSKAALLSAGKSLAQVRSTHSALGRLLDLLKRNRALRQRRKVLLQDHWSTILDGLRDIAREVERCSPAIAGEGPNLEYPWRQPGGAVVAPCDHAWAFDPRVDRRGSELMRLVGQLLDEFETLFPPTAQAT